jgi:hypothetical protein
MPTNAAFFKIIKDAIAMVCMALILLACGGGGSTDTAAPTVISQTPTTGLIAENVPITIQFSESIDTSSYTLGGNLAAESDGGVWSQTNTIDDTLTITPMANWSANTNRSLIINARDMAGNGLATLTVMHDVYHGTLFYVSAAAVDDTGDGMTPITAKHTIMAAINAASVPATVLVEAGVYHVSVSTTPRIVLKEGVSLYGGYNPGFGDRVAGTSIIVDESVLPTTTLPNPNYAVLGNAEITAATLLDGFTIQGAGSGSNITAGLRLRDGAAPIVQNNTINGGSGSSTSYAVYLYNTAAPLIQHNAIYGGSGGTSSAGIYTTDSSPVILNNLIEGGSGSNSSYAVISSIDGAMQIRANRIFGGSGSDFTAGISAARGTHTIENNLIHAGQGAQSHGVLNTEASMTVRNNSIYGGSGITKAVGLEYTYSTPLGSFDIENNIILTQSPNGICIKTDIAWPTHNNDFHCAGALYQYNVSSYLGLNNAGNLTPNADGTGTELSPSGANNVSVDPQLADIDGADNNINTMDDNDWHLSASSPASVSAGGLNGIDQGWLFTTDKDDVTRPASGNPWSIGAYEP